MMDTRSTTLSRVDGSSASSAPSGDSRPWRVPYVLAAIFVVLAIGIVGAGYFYYRHYEQQYREEVERQLLTISTLKTDDLVNWRKERLGDAHVFFKNAAFSALVRRYFDTPGDVGAAEQIRTWLAQVQTSYRYDRVFLLDGRYSKKMTVPDGPERSDSYVSEHTNKALQSGEIAFEDLYWNEQNQRIYLKVLVPIFEGGSGSRLMAVLALRIDPETQLFPFIKRWPTSSRTAETLLVRRDGDKAVFLNELRFKKGTALKLSVPLKEGSTIPAIKAALGQEGIVEGLDYRGVPVVAAVRAVPDSPWFMVARMDRSEVYAPVVERLWLTIALVGVMLLSAGAAFGMAWRQQRVRFYRERVRISDSLRQSEDRFRIIFESCHDAMMTLEPPLWKFTSGNPATVKMFMAENEEDFISHGPCDLSPERQPDGRASSEKAKEMIETAMREGSCFFEWAHKRIDGAEFPATVLLTRMEYAGKAVLQATVRDITEQKRAEEEVKESEKLYRQLFNSMSDAVFLHGIGDDGLPGVFGEVNEVACRRLGYTQEELLAMRPMDIDAPEGIAMIPGMMKDWRASGHAVWEGVHLAKDGRKIPVELGNTTFNIGGTEMMLTTARDITDRKRAENELARERENLKAIFEASPVGMLLMDENAAVTAVNDVTARLAGKTAAGMVGVQPGDALGCVHAGEHPKGCGNSPSCPSCQIRATIEGVLKSGQAARGLEVQPILVLGGTEARPWLDIGVGPVMIDGRRHVLASIVNITERKEAEEDKARLLTIIDKSPDFIGVADMQGNLMFHNRAAMTMVGLPEDADLSHMKIRDMHPERAAKLVEEEGIATILRQGVWKSENVLLHRNGSEIHVSQVLVVHRDSAGQPKYISTIMRDITDRKRAEEQLLQAKDEAEAANHAKSTFLANMSHEIRTPMTAILGFTEVIGNSIECCTTCPEHKICPIRVQNKENIQVIQRNGEHLLGLINDILDLSKVEAGKMEVERVACSSVQIVEEAVSLMRVRAIKKGLTLDARYEFPLPEAILSDPARVRQILVNLVGNAVKFTSQGGVEIVVRCMTDIQAARAVLAFDVKDTGIGMTPEQVDRIFQPFVQADSSTTRQFGGTGLGLAISKKLAEALGGDIQVASRPGEGSTFTFTLEAALPAPARMLTDLSEMVPHSPHQPRSASQAAVVKLRGRVLLAEDGPDNQRLISMILRTAGAEVDLVANGLLAVEKAMAALSAGTPYDAILMDMQMPEMDGYEAAGKLRQSGYKGPIIALTAHAMSGDRAKCIAAGCDDYATKPVDRSALLATLARLMGCPQPEPQKSPAEAEPAPTKASSDEAIASTFRDDPDMAGIIADFVGQLPRRLAEMRQAAANNQWEVLQRAAHQLKGAGGSYGYSCLTDVARELESHAKQQDTEAAMLMLASLAKLCERVQAGHAAEAATQDARKT